MNITNIQDSAVTVTDHSPDDIRTGYTLYVGCVSGQGFLATVTTDKNNNQFNIDDSNPVCHSGIAHRIDKSIGHDISVVDRMELLWWLCESARRNAMVSRKVIPQCLVPVSKVLDGRI